MVQIGWHRSQHGDGQAEFFPRCDRLKARAELFVVGHRILQCDRLIGVIDDANDCGQILRLTAARSHYRYARCGLQHLFHHALQGKGRHQLCRIICVDGDGFLNCPAQGHGVEFHQDTTTALGRRHACPFRRGGATACVGNFPDREIGRALIGEDDLSLDESAGGDEPEIVGRLGKVDFGSTGGCICFYGWFRRERGRGQKTIKKSTPPGETE